MLQNLNRPIVKVDHSHKETKDSKLNNEACKNHFAVTNALLYTIFVSLLWCENMFITVLSTVYTNVFFLFLQLWNLQQQYENYINKMYPRWKEELENYRLSQQQSRNETTGGVSNYFNLQ